MLVADPSQRMGMDEIKVNQWFLAGLPPGALEMNDHLISSCNMLDEVRRRQAAVSFRHQAGTVGGAVLLGDARDA